MRGGIRNIIKYNLNSRRQDWLRQAGGDMMNNQIKPEDNNNNNGLKGNYENQFNQQDSLINQVFFLNYKLNSIFRYHEIRVY